MRKTLILIAAAAGLAACGQSNEQPAANAEANTAAAEKPRPAYCFFKDSETRGWKAKVDKSGNVTVSGKAFREDARYQAVLAPATVSGTTAEISPTITQNSTGFGAQDNWWDVTQTIADSSAVTTINVTCGAKTIASLTVPRKK